MLRRRSFLVVVAALVPLRFPSLDSGAERLIRAAIAERYRLLRSWWGPDVVKPDHVTDVAIRLWRNGRAPWPVHPFADRMAAVYECIATCDQEGIPPSSNDVPSPTLGGE